MTPQKLIAAFDTLADAHDGMTRLRELVLQLAMRGQLMPQDPMDEPAAVLLARIADEKARLFKENKIRKPKRSPPVTKKDVPFEVPPAWEWCRFGDVTDARLGKMLDKAKNRGPLRAYIRNANLQWFEFVLDDVKQLRLDDSELDACTVAEGDLVICEGGEPGRCAVVNETAAGMVYQKAIHRARPLCAVSPWYLAYILRRDAYSGRLAELFTGATIKHLTGRSLAAYTIPLPPVAEQHRIVARVDELMGLLDRLEAARDARDGTRAALRDAALAALRDAEDADAVKAAWTRIADHMVDLFTDPADVAPLRQTILQLAVRGRLVRQDPGDEPAMALIARAVEEMEQLRKAKVTRIGKDPGGYERTDSLPAGWSWAPLQHLVQFIDYRGKTPKKTSSGVRLITAKNIKRGYIQRQPEEFVSEATYIEWMTRGFPQEGDVLFTTEAPMGHAALVDLDERFALAQRSINLHPYAGVLGAYLVVMLLAPWFAEELAKRATGMTATGIKAAKLRLIRVPVPPLFEQRRIAMKVDELLALCDDLEARLAAANNSRAAFAAAAVHHLDAG